MANVSHRHRNTPAHRHRSKPKAKCAKKAFVKEYEALFKQMMVKNTIPKRFALYDSPAQMHIGMGNRFLSLCFLFIFALLTGRVLLLSERSSADIAELFYPPPGIEWSFDKIAPMFNGTPDISALVLGDDPDMLCHANLSVPDHFVIYQGNSYNHYLLPQNQNYSQRIQTLFNTNSTYSRMQQIMQYLFGSPKPHYVARTQHLMYLWNRSNFDHFVGVQFRAFRGDPSYKHMAVFRKPTWKCMSDQLKALRLPPKKTLIFYTTDDKTMWSTGIKRLSSFGKVVINPNGRNPDFRIGALEWLILSRVEILITTGTTYPMTAHYVAGSGQKLIVAGRHQFGFTAWGGQKNGIWCDTVPKPGKFSANFDDMAVLANESSFPAGLSCQKASGALASMAYGILAGRMVIRRDPRKNHTYAHFRVPWCMSVQAAGCVMRDASMFKSLLGVHWNGTSELRQRSYLAPTNSCYAR